MGIITKTCSDKQYLTFTLNYYHHISLKQHIVIHE